MNNVNLIGRLTWDPEFNMSQSGSDYCKFSIAVNRPFKTDEADFIKCVAFGVKADIIKKYVHKGDRVGVSGRLQMGRYKIKDETRITYSVVVEAIELLSPKNKEIAQTNNDSWDDEDFPFL
ncbi:Single-stranded DNA-binding protein A [Fusobacterium sp. DD29]|uniref:single-stranded DNA-binding protein n=1 Tax=unclassified Fusobacterium TaxID=2648384 RepID=UPI001B8CFEE9|nr:MULTISPECIES: single-stranded DNA-binding protein [unclassified Fusobacterium]MBR8811428.1 Single-stranded DNA-binding protein A [Fusobacterium sp. DD14]MBR8700260.1 Single-stranded DNA-binding protein A [Fusobacterium sp. DD45]MBR8710485.1 Single-stranded DNA-binding protein A [Fusobacterium sp. DD28]MBR8748957.1 Single-stranded DNA-binding protein A [Fusobacterium sp. DD29]MBR8751065.1 Single-stranded DNA-binding protein A [Fusobacterium sp. DD26]